MSEPLEAELPKFVDELGVGVVLHDAETGAVLAANERFEEILGHDSEEFWERQVGVQESGLQPHTKAQALERVRAAAAGTTQQFEWQIQQPTGDRRQVDVQLRPTRIDGDQYVVAEVRDITDYTRRERRLQLLYRVVRHNLRNRMNVVIGYADSIYAALEEGELRGQAERIADIATEVGEFSETIRQIQDVVELSNASGDPIPLKPIVERVVEQYRVEYPTADIELEATEEVWIRANDGVRYAIEHAVENAIEHNDDPNPVVRVSVTTSADGECVLVRVEDNGPPIPEMEIQVLDPDIRKSSTYHGTGIGLWVMRWCADVLGGELTFTASDDGNVITFKFPAIDRPG